MRTLILISITFLLFGLTSCDEGEDLPRKNVAVWVQFDVKTSLGEDFPGVNVILSANKFNLTTGLPTGDEFAVSRTSNSNGSVEWSGVSYNINSEEIISIAALGSITVQGQEYTGTTTIVYNFGDAPGGFLKTKDLYMNF